MTYDVVIVGAGPAGIGAARALAAAGRTALLLEARDRVGGRVQTVLGPRGDVIDLGAAWLHSASSNPMTALARAAGMEIDRRTPDSWALRLARSGHSPAEIADFETCYAAHQQKMKDSWDDGSPDLAVASFLEQGSRWNALIGALTSFATGTLPENVSSTAKRFRVDTGENWRPVAGYGRLIEGLASGLDIRFNAPVSRIDWSGPEVVVHAAGQEVRAARVIVTVPVSVLAAGGIAFTPALDPDQEQAIAAIPLGRNNKVYFDLPELVGGMERDAHFIGRTDTTETGSYQPHPAGRPLLEMFLGDALAGRLEDDGPAAMADFARTEVRNMFGSAALPGDLAVVASSAWIRDPWSLGAYTYSPPGMMAQREILARPVGGRIFFAGEACSRDWHSTVIGAWQTALEAAVAVTKDFTTTAA